MVGIPSYGKSIVAISSKTSASLSGGISQLLSQSHAPFPSETGAAAAAFFSQQPASRASQNVEEKEREKERREKERKGKERKGKRASQTS